jgi:hypothetical protein
MIFIHDDVEHLVLALGHGHDLSGREVALDVKAEMVLDFSSGHAVENGLVAYGEQKSFPAAFS